MVKNTGVAMDKDTTKKDRLLESIKSQMDELAAEGTPCTLIATWDDGTKIILAGDAALAKPEDS